VITQREEEDDVSDAVCVVLCGQSQVCVCCICVPVCVPPRNTCLAPPQVQAGAIKLWQPCPCQGTGFDNVLTYKSNIYLSQSYTVNILKQADFDNKKNTLTPFHEAKHFKIQE